MAGSDLEERFGKIPGNRQRTSCLAVIDSAQLTFARKEVQGPIRPSLDDASVCCRHDRGQSDPADVMENPGRVGEVLVQESALCAALGDNRAGDAVTPAQHYQRRERVFEIRLQA